MVICSIQNVLNFPNIRPINKANRMLHIKEVNLNNRQALAINKCQIKTSKAIKARYLVLHLRNDAERF